jgi:ABC-type dipeptide/oligopeptide/nickel transport system permease subunit
MKGTHRKKSFEEITADEVSRYRRGSLSLAARQFIRNRAALAGLISITLLVIFSVFASVLTPYDPIAISLSEKLQPPSLSHWLGTDYFGRDVLTRVVYGGRVSLSVGLLVIGFAVLIGVPIGLISGFFGGRVDNFLMRLMDAFLTFPPLLLAVAIVGILGPDIQNVMLALGIVRIPVFARTVRGNTLAVREEVYVRGAHAIGASPFRIAVSHILRNVVAPIVVLMTVNFAAVIIAEASLSFLGLGAQPPDPSWGRDLSEARRYLEDAPWLMFGPTAAIVGAVLSVNFIGDGLRDALDPRSWRTWGENVKKANLFKNSDKRNRD